MLFHFLIPEFIIHIFIPLILHHINLIIHLIFILIKHFLFKAFKFMIIHYML